MEDLVFFKAMSRGHYSEGSECNPDKCSYCIFYSLIDASITEEHMSGDDSHLVLELNYGDGDLLGEFRIRQQDTNVIIEESAQGRFRAYLEDKTVKYIGHLIMYALRFKISDLSSLMETCTTDMKLLEDDLDNCIDNSGTYQILDFRRKYTQYGDSLLHVKEILARIDKGYYPMQMQNSYVLQGEIRLEFDFLEQRYELLKNTLIKDLDTYTSIINNNINRNTRLLSIISLVSVVMNFLFGSLLAVNPILGIVGGVVIGGLSAGATLSYHIRRRGGAVPLTPGSRRISLPFGVRAQQKQIDPPMDQEKSS